MFPRRPAVVRRRPLLRTAVVGGGAYMAGRATAQRTAGQSEREAAQDARISDLENARQQEQAPPAPGPDADVFGQLHQLIQMHERGALTDEEFSAAKARVLASA
jgi:Short C-terminal domain